MILSDTTINYRHRKQPLLDPFVPENVQPASVDVTLGADFKDISFHGGLIDPQRPVSTDTLSPERMSGAGLDLYVIQPGEFVLGTTVERVMVPDDLVARIEGKSSLARLGLLVHATAGFIDPGFHGQVTLELHNVAPRGILLRPGMKIAQISFEELSTPAARPYGHPDLGSKYQGQVGATPSRYHENDDQALAT